MIKEAIVKLSKRENLDIDTTHTIKDFASWVNV